MSCKDIAYRISKGKLSVKSIGSENGKKIYAVFGCKDDANDASSLIETRPVVNGDDSDDNDEDGNDESEEGNKESGDEGEMEDDGSTDDDDTNQVC